MRLLIGGDKLTCSIVDKGRVPRLGPAPSKGLRAKRRPSVHLQPPRQPGFIGRWRAAQRLEPYAGA